MTIVLDLMEPAVAIRRLSAWGYDLEADIGRQIGRDRPRGETERHTTRTEINHDINGLTTNLQDILSFSSVCFGACATSSVTCTYPGQKSGAGRSGARLPCLKHS